MTEIRLTIPDQVAEYLAVLTDPGQGPRTIGEVVYELIDHAQQGVYRPGAWEHTWICQVFGDAWLERMEPDDRPEMLSGDGRVIFDRPKRSEEGDEDAR